MALTLAGAAATVSSNRSAAPFRPEPSSLGRTRIDGSFGLGAGVVWPQADRKQFHFQLQSPTPVVALVHLRTAELSDGEVAVLLNGVKLGALPASLGRGADDFTETEVVLPTRHLRLGAENVLLFEHVRNPPGTETWQISDLWLEVLPVPQLSPAETRRKAAALLAQGEALDDARAVSADNLFRSWKAYRQAWISLQALEERPALAVLVEERLQRLSRDLHARCATLSFQVRRALHLGQKSAAVRGVQDLLQAFPSVEHRCHGEALRWRQELEN